MTNTNIRLQWRRQYASWLLDEMEEEAVTSYEIRKICRKQIRLAQKYPQNLMQLEFAIQSMLVMAKIRRGEDIVPYLEMIEISYRMPLCDN